MGQLYFFVHRAVVHDVNRDGFDDVILEDGSGNWYVALSDGTNQFVTRAFTSYFVEISEPTVTGLEVADYDYHLDTALQQFEWVRNNVPFDPSYGAMKGAQATLETGLGNAWDQTSALKQEIDTLWGGTSQVRFVVGELTADGDDVQKWLGAKSSQAAANVLGAAGVLVSWFETQNTSGHRFHHAWSEIRLPGPGTTGLTYLPFDPSWKFRDLQPGVVGILSNVQFDEVEYIYPQTAPFYSFAYTNNFDTNEVTQQVRTTNTTFLGPHFRERQGNYQIISQELRSDAGASAVSLATFDDRTMLNSITSITIDTTDLTTSTQAVGLIARYVDPDEATANDESMYLAEVALQGSVRKVTLHKIVNGTKTALTSAATLPNGVLTLSLDVRGDTVAIVNGSTDVFRITDNSITSRGAVGIRSVDTTYIDDFNVQSFDPPDALPLDLYQDSVEAYLKANHPDVSLADVPYDGPIIPEVYNAPPGLHGNRTLVMGLVSGLHLLG